MATAPNSDDALLDQFLKNRGHDTDSLEWEASYNKKQCPECSALHQSSASKCSVCGWNPER
ncbi:MAG: hypothetical protein J07HQX50_00892 [Haloquadratum sp. J07HQX50]|nr:MAG: hypothetical protein J07HQX50_00892 [Haloquadratum sp. J07HQX50]